MNLPVELKGLTQVDPSIVLKGVLVTPATTPVTATCFNSLMQVTSCQGATVPSYEAGFAKGCKFIKTDMANGKSAIYENIGDATTSNFVISPTYVTDSAPTKATPLRLYTGTVTGTLVVGETVSQASTSATGVVAAKGTGYIDITGPTGTFNASNLVTGGTSSATFTPTMTALNVWTPAFTPVTPIVGASGATAYTQVSSAVLLTTAKFRYQKALNQIETLLADSVSTFNLEYGA